jgi:hypothetical protein
MSDWATAARQSAGTGYEGVEEDKEEEARAEASAASDTIDSRKSRGDGEWAARMAVDDCAVRVQENDVLTTELPWAKSVSPDRATCREHFRPVSARVFPTV